MQKIDSRDHLFSESSPKEFIGIRVIFEYLRSGFVYFSSQNKRKLMLPCKLFISNAKEEHC